MIKNVNKIIDDYFIRQQAMKNRPTMKSLSTWLGFSYRTLYNIKAGYYSRGHPYTRHPVTTRKVANKDFPAIREACEDIKKMKERKQ